VNHILWKIYAFFYDALFELLPYQQLLNTTTSAIRPEKGVTRLLDAGCGTANLELMISRNRNDQEYLIEAIDSSSAMLNKARRKLKSCNWVAFKRVNLNHPLPFADEAFDNIVCINSIYATQDPKRVLEEFSRTLRSGGTLILVNPKKNPKIISVLVEHLRLSMQLKGWKKIRLFARNLIYLPQFFLVILLNLLIKSLSRNAVYHFFNMDECQELVSRCQFRIIDTTYEYGDTDIFVVAEKEPHFS